MSLIVVGEVFRTADILTQVLTLRPSHHLLIPGDQAIVPVTLGINMHVITAILIIGFCGGRGCGSSGCGGSCCGCSCSNGSFRGGSFWGGSFWVVVVLVVVGVVGAGGQGQVSKAGVVG